MASSECAGTPSSSPYSLLTIHYSLSFPSHQTTKFPPTPSIHATSASHVRMIDNSTITLTVIEIRATIPHARR